VNPSLQFANDIFCDLR